MLDQPIFSGKTVAVIGNSPTANEPGAEDYDVIIRCDVLPQDRRTDVFFLDKGLAREDWPVKFAHVNAKRDDSAEVVASLRCAGVPFALYAVPPLNTFWGGDSLRWPGDLQAGLGCRPFAGFMAIYRALRLGARRLYITGFDFCRQPDGKFPERVGPHLIGPHMAQMRAWAQQTNVCVDDTLVKILGFGNRKNRRIKLCSDGTRAKAGT